MANRSLITLLVDDDSLQIQRLAHGLEQASERLRVETATQPSVALDRLESVDCVVTRYDMATTGVELTRRIRARDPDVPVIVFAADGSETVASESLAAGATDYVVDKGDHGRLAHRIEDVADASAARRDGVTASEFEALLDDVTGGAPAFASNAQGTVVWASDGMADVFGLDHTDLVGRDRRYLVRNRLAERVEEPRRFANQVLSGGNALLYIEREGEARWLSHGIRRLTRGPYEGGRLDRFEDVTSYVDDGRGFRDFQRIVSGDESFSERLNAVLALGSDLLDLPYGFVTAIDQDRQTILESVGDHEHLQPGASAPLEESYCRRTVAADDLVAIRDAADAGWADDPAYELFELDSYIGAPVRPGGEQYGTLCFASREARDSFDETEQLFVEFAAAWAGYELERIGYA